MHDPRDALARRDRHGDDELPVHVPLGDPAGAQHLVDRIVGSRGTAPGDPPSPTVVISDGGRATGGQLDWVVDTVTGEFGKIHDYFFQPEVWARFLRMPQVTAVPMIYHDAGRVRAGLQSLHYFQQTRE